MATVKQEHQRPGGGQLRQAAHCARRVGKLEIRGDLPDPGERSGLQWRRCHGDLDLGCQRKIRGAAGFDYDDGMPSRDNLWVQIARYSQLGFVLPAATVVGWLIGAGLDMWLHTKWLYLVGLLVGIAAGFVELVRTVTSGEKQ